MTMPHAYSDQAAPIKAVTPETDTLLPERLQDHTDADYMALVNHARKLERERDEARWHADADVCNSIECGSSAPGKDGWRKDCEADEYELRYAAKRTYHELEVVARMGIDGDAWNERGAVVSDPPPTGAVP